MENFKYIQCEGEFINIDSISPTIEYDSKLMEHFWANKYEDIIKDEIIELSTLNEDNKDQIISDEIVENNHAHDYDQVPWLSAINDVKKNSPSFEIESFASSYLDLEMEEKNVPHNSDNPVFKENIVIKEELEFLSSRAKINCSYNLRPKAYDSSRSKLKLRCNSSLNEAINKESSKWNDNNSNKKMIKSLVPVFIYKFSPQVIELPHINPKISYPSHLSGECETFFNKKRTKFSLINKENHYIRKRLRKFSSRISPEKIKYAPLKTSNNEIKVKQIFNKGKYCNEENNKVKSLSKCRKVKNVPKYKRKYLKNENCMVSPGCQVDRNSKTDCSRLKKFNFVVAFKNKKRRNIKMKAKSCIKHLKINNLKLTTPRSKTVCDMSEEKSLFNNISKGRRLVKRLTSNEVQLIKIPTGHYGCSACLYKHKQKNQVETHIMRHLGYKPFQCSLCPYSSIDRSHLSRHLKIHTGEHPHKCHVCSYSCIQKVSLNIHTLKHK